MPSKNRYELLPGRMVGPIELEMSRNAIRTILGNPERIIEGDLFLTDAYDSKDLRIDYSFETNTCKGIQVFNGAELIYNGVDLLGWSWPQMLRWMELNDPELDIDVGIYISHALRISTGPKLDPDSDIDKVRSIVIFAPDYWPSDEEMNALVEKDIRESPSAEEMARELGLEDFMRQFQ